jgi:hypothetical protein
LPFSIASGFPFPQFSALLSALKASRQSRYSRNGIFVAVMQPVAMFLGLVAAPVLMDS